MPTTTTKTTTRKPAAKKTAPAMPATEDVADRFEDVLEDVVKFVRDATHTYMGMGLVVQRRLINRDVADKLTIEGFLEESKAKGLDLATEIQDRIEPLAQRVADRVEPITERFEANLPAPVKEALETSRERVRTLLAV